MDYSVNTTPLIEEDEDEENEENDIPNQSGIDLPIDLQPKDRFNYGYRTFYLLGIITLLPYTFFVTANDYWMFKLRDTTTNITHPANKTTLQAEFTSYLTIAATGPSVFFLFLNSFFSHRISIGIRMYLSLTVILFCFLVTLVLVEIDTDSWQSIFFAVTITSVVIVNVVGALFQAGLLGIASKIGTKYVSAVVSGQAAGGIFPAIAYIFSLKFGATPAHSALLYFSIANVTITLGLIAFYLLSKTVAYTSCVAYVYVMSN